MICMAIPEVFSPNSDGINDYLTILAFKKKRREVVYSTNDMQSSVGMGHIMDKSRR